MIRDNDLTYTLQYLWDHRDEFGFLEHTIPEIQDMDGTLFLNTSETYYTVNGAVKNRYILMDRAGNLMDGDLSLAQLPRDAVLLKLSCKYTQYIPEGIVLEYICFPDRINIEMIVNLDNKPECRICTESVTGGKIVKNLRSENGVIIEDSYVMNTLIQNYQSNKNAAIDLFAMYF